MPTKPRPVPRGLPLVQSEQEEAVAAQPTPAQIEDALRTWREDAPREVRALLDATLTGEAP